MKKLTIWNKFIQSLILSSDSSSVRLALILLDDYEMVMNWWYSGSDCTFYSLPVLSYYYDHVPDEVQRSNLYQNLEAHKRTTAANIEYIKKLYHDIFLGQNNTELNCE